MIRSLLVVLVLTTTAQAGKLIATGDSWRYFKGTSFPTGWTTNGFNDTGWLTGPSGFGYGDNDDATGLNDMTNSVGGYVSVFTRQTFHIATPATINILTLAVDYDDGFVAYLNDTEIARRNLPGGAITHTTIALNSHEASQGNSGPQPKELITVNPALLLTGDNVLAVSGHNISTSSTDLSLIVELLTNEVNLTRGPYIQMPESNQVTVVWRTDAATDSAVDYGLDLSYSGGTVSNSTPAIEHVINIPGLQEGTNYFYRVRSGGVTLSEGSALRTKRTASQPFRFVAFGDWGQGTAGMFNIANQVNAVSDLDFYITLGDNIYDNGEAEKFDPYWFTPYGPTLRRTPVFSGIGNHDVGNGGNVGQPYLDNFFLPLNGPVSPADMLERNYSFDYGNAHFVTFDSNPFTNVNLNAARIAAIKTWLSNDLAATTKPWKFVYFHHPPYTSDGGVHADDQGVKTNVMPIIEAAGVQFVFDGHNHFYERINAINGTYHIISGGGGAGLNGPTNRKTYSAALRADVHSFSLVDVDGTRLKLRQMNASGSQIDEFNLDIGHPFKINGLIDDVAWLRADNGLKLYAAIRKNYLYLATQDAGEGSDHFIYLNNQTSTNRPTNWAKSGTVMQWNAFLADENDSAFTSWYGSTEAARTNFPAYQAMTSGLDDNGAAGNGVLEGTVDLIERFGTFPTNLFLAGAAYATADNGALVVQVPVGNGSPNISEGEYLNISTRALALDLPVANAGTDFNIEAGMPAALNGTGSTAPSELPLSFNWTQVSGAAVTLVNSNAATASFTATTTGARTFQLEVNDTRFSSNDTVTVTVTALTDTDGDGLSDQEELTGQDNILTLPNPQSQITDHQNPDSDDDGQNDGAEALAGTDPNDANSVLKIVRVSGAFELEWTTVAGKPYQVQYRDSLTNSWLTLSNFTATATGTTNLLDISAPAATNRFYRIIIP